MKINPNQHNAHIATDSTKNSAPVQNDVYQTMENMRDRYRELSAEYQNGTLPKSDLVSFMQQIVKFLKTDKDLIFAQCSANGFPPGGTFPEDPKAFYTGALDAAKQFKKGSYVASLYSFNECVTQLTYLVGNKNPNG